jgi:hypothetical protein
MPKTLVSCSECGNELNRWLINPNIKEPTKNFFCNKECKGKWQVKQRELLGFTKEWLIGEYIDKNKSANQIAREINRDPKRVWEWLKNYNIPTRSRGHNTDQLPKDGSSFKGRTHSEKTKEIIRQARLKDGHVPYLVNGEHWLKVYNAKPATYRGGISPERQSFYSSTVWIEAIKEVWKRDNATCQRCGKHHNETNNRGTFHIHHIISFQNKETRADIHNLVLLCRKCHLFIHSKKNIGKQFIKEIGYASDRSVYCR